MIEDVHAAQAAMTGPDEPGELFREIETALGEASRSPELPRLVQQALDQAVNHLGEASIGGPWEPRDDLWRHTVSVLKVIAGAELEGLTRELGSWRAAVSGCPPADTLLPLYLWWQVTELWDRSLAYHSIHVINQAVASTACGDTAAPGRAGRTQPAGLVPDVWSAIRQALALIEADGAVYKQINLSSPAGLGPAARRGVAAAAATVTALDRLVGLAERPADLSEQAWDGLRFVREDARQCQLYYETLAGVAGTLAEFEQWLATSTGAEPPRAAAGVAGRTLAAPDAPLASIEASLRRVRAARQDLSGRVLSECEPWEYLLAEMHRLVTSGGQGGAVGTALVPRRLWVRYCYPFAVEGTRQPSLAHLHPKLGRGRAGPEGQHVESRLAGRLREEFSDALGPDVMTVGEPEELATTEFFQAPGAEEALFGGVRVRLSAVDLITDAPPGASEGARRQRCSVWLDLNRMGNFCLCVEPGKPLRDVPPPLLYRVFRAGTPFALGQRVTLVRPGSGAEADSDTCSWDNLQTFARDIIRAAADACYWKQAKEPGLKKNPGSVAPFYPGNVHLVAVMQTDGPLGAQAGEVAARLDSAVGGRIVLRSIQRAAGTVDEWLRFPPLQQAGSIRGSVIAAVPEIGYAGDWLVHTGETTVFGIVAVPQWLRDVYPETAEFAGSWAPRFRLWGKRLQDAVDGLRAGGIQLKEAEELRAVEQRVRLHLSQINSEQLCATLANRRFLDELLEMAGVRRMQRDLEAQLAAAEKLTDWFSDHQEQRSARRRDSWLFLIALLGIFSLADFMALANTTNLHQKWFGFINLTDNGVWQDWLILGLFAGVFIAGLFVLGAHQWLRQRLASVWHRLMNDRPDGSSPRSR